MLIGIISDTHDNITNIKKAVELFNKNNVEFVIHAGDVVAPGTINFFKGLKMKFIFGNCDSDRRIIEVKCKELGFEHHGKTMNLELDGKKIGVFHGDNQAITNKMLSAGYDYFIHGHTHIPEDKMYRKTRILCPGGHYRGDEKESNKIIILDTHKNKTLFLGVN